MMDHKIMPHHIQQPLQKPPASSGPEKTAQQASFQSILEEQFDGTAELKMSKHAEKRLNERGITVSEDTWNDMHERVKEAKEKGVDDSLVLTNEAAFVVSARNETVITAMDREEAGSQLFTNINGAIIIDE